MTDRPLRTKQIAHLLNRSERTIRRYFREGKLKGAFKLGGTTAPIEIALVDLEKLKTSEAK